MRNNITIIHNLTLTIVASFTVTFFVFGDTKAEDGCPVSSVDRPGAQAGERGVLVWDGMEIYFRWCPPGTFVMGSPEQEADRMPGNWEKQHSVRLTRGFWALETEVSQLLYEKVAGSNPSFFKKDDYPVEMIGFPQCVKFCKRFSELTGLRATVPTEAQWEYACRAGGHEPWNFGADPIGKGRFRVKGDPIVGPAAVGSYPANAWGLHDMHGNVAEWVSDWFDPDYYPRSPENNPAGPERGSNKVLRGGGWSTPAEYCRSAFRNLDVEPYACSSSYGFRFIITP